MLQNHDNHSKQFIKATMTKLSCTVLVFSVSSFCLCFLQSQLARQQPPLILGSALPFQLASSIATWRSFFSYFSSSHLVLLQSPPPMYLQFSFLETPSLMQVTITLTGTAPFRPIFHRMDQVFSTVLLGGSLMAEQQLTSFVSYIY